MSGTHLLVTRSDYYILLNSARGAAQRMKVVRETLRPHAMMILEKATARVPVEKASVVAAYRARGIEPVWKLDDDDAAIVFCLRLRDFDPSPAEQEAAKLLVACVCAEQAGDVPEFADGDAGRRQREANKVGGRALKKLTASQELQIAKQYSKAVSERAKSMVRSKH